MKRVDFENPWLVTVSVFILSMGVLVQTAFVILLNRQVEKRLRRLATHIQPLSETLGGGVGKVHRVLGSIQEQTTALSKIQDTLGHQLPSFVEQVRQVDQAVGRQIDLMRYQLQQAGAVVDGAVNQVSQQTFRLHQATQHSPVGIATLFQSGLKTVLRLFTTKPTRPASHAGDVEDFI